MASSWTLNFVRRRLCYIIWSSWLEARSNSPAASWVSVPAAQVEEAFGSALGAGIAKARAKVASALFAVATDPSHPGFIAAAIYWSKVHRFWSEARPVPAQPSVDPSAGAGRLSDAEVRSRFAEMQAALQVAPEAKGTE